MTFKLNCNIIYVDIDTRVCTDNRGYEVIDVVEYLDCDLIQSKKNILRFNPDYCRYSLYINNAGYENIPYICEELSKIPGVLSAGYYFDFFDFGA